MVTSSTAPYLELLSPFLLSQPHNPHLTVKLQVCTPHMNSTILSYHITRPWLLTLSNLSILHPESGTQRVYVLDSGVYPALCLKGKPSIDSGYHLLAKHWYHLQGCKLSVILRISTQETKSSMRTDHPPPNTPSFYIQGFRDSHEEIWGEARGECSIKCWEVEFQNFSRQIQD